MSVQKLPKPGSYKAYLLAQQQLDPTHLTTWLSKGGFMKQKSQASKASKAAQKAANAATKAAAKAAGASFGDQLASGILPGEAQPGAGESVPFAGGASTSTLAKIAALALPLGLVGLAAWWFLKRRRKK